MLGAIDHGAVLLGTVVCPAAATDELIQINRTANYEDHRNLALVHSLSG
jgi:hypothetical protein